MRERLERQKIEHENELLKIKTEQIASQQRVEELYLNALNAMKSYSGSPVPEEGEDEPD